MPDTGLQEIEMIVAHREGCQDTARAFIDVLPLTTWFMPNAFTPNNDGLNDFFLGKGDLLGISDFQLQVWDRWGSLVYQTNDPDAGWNGRKNNAGRLAPDGVYVWHVSFTGPRGVPNEYRGFVSLMR
jgi:gliding motility-associated-like protein